MLFYSKQPMLFNSKQQSSQPPFLAHPTTWLLKYSHLLKPNIYCLLLLTLSPPLRTPHHLDTKFICIWFGRWRLNREKGTGNSPIQPLLSNAFILYFSFIILFQSGEFETFNSHVSCLDMPKGNFYVSSNPIPLNFPHPNKKTEKPI